MSYEYKIELVEELPKEIPIKKNGTLDTRNEWENKTVSDSYHVYNAVFTATYNVNRKKNKRALKLWKKVKMKRADIEVISENMKVIKEVEQKEGLSWVDEIYRANGFPL